MSTFSYPGVYVREVPSGDRSVAGVSTSVTAFVGYTARGKLGAPVRVQSFGEYERHFGGLHAQSEISYAVRQYFQNGGTEAIIVRTATDAQAAAVVVKNGTAAGATPVLALHATSEGAWGNGLRVMVDWASANPDSLFNLIVGEYKEGASAPVNQEVFRNLSMNPASASYAPNVISSQSKLVRATSLKAEDALTTKGTSESGSLTPFPTLTNADRLLKVAINGEGPYEIALFPADGGASVTTVAQLATLLQTAIQSASGTEAFTGATVTVVGDKLTITSGIGGKYSAVVVTGAGAAKLKLGVQNGGREVEAAAAVRPAPTGTLSAPISLTTAALTGGESTTVKVMAGTVELANQTFALPTAPASLAQLATALQTQLRAITPANARLKNLTVKVVGDRLLLQPSSETGEALLSFEDVAEAESLTEKLGLANALVNVQWYALGSPISVGAQVADVAGHDGKVPTVTDLLGTEAAKTGLYALEDADLFNLLCIPRMAEVGETEAKQIISEAMAYCDKRRAFLLVDPPSNIQNPAAMAEWIHQAPRHKNAAIYYPQVLVADPLNGFRLKSLPPSGTVAGIFARTDAARGIWKVPAGVDAAMVGVQGLAYNLTDAESGVLNELAVNCLRNFPTYGKVVWGARTLAGADEMVSEWKYIAPRRLALFIQESLYRGTKWVVFEPNDEPLWSQVRLSVGSFLNRLYRQGAFQGSPNQAYFVQCDASINTADEIAQGVINIGIGFAPVKPAEFVVLQLQQIAGAAQA